MSKLTRKEISNLIYFFDFGITSHEFYKKKLEGSAKNKVEKIRDKLYKMKEELKEKNDG